MFTESFPVSFSASRSEGHRPRTLLHPTPDYETGSGRLSDRMETYELIETLQLRKTQIVFEEEQE